MRWWAVCAALTVLAAPGAAQCPTPAPDSCKCLWKYGKQYVECRNAGLRTVPRGLDASTQVLDLSGNELHELPAEEFRRAGLLNLQKIYLSDCRLSSVSDTALAGLTNLVDLDLSGNTLTAIPQGALRSVPALRELRMANNPVQRVEADALAAVPGLVKLDLSDCQIFDVEPPAFDPLGILESLKISGNRLQALAQPTVVALRRVHNVELHANPWECDCRLLPMRDWLQRNNIPYPIAPTCHGPPRLAGRTFEELPADQFACRPQLLPMVREVAVTADHNATFTCRVGAVPAARVSWFWRGRQLDNTTLLPGGRRPHILERGGRERVSRLVIPAVRAADADADFHCVGANPAGDVETNFTLSVAEKVEELESTDAGLVAGLTVGLLLALVVGITVVYLLMRRLRRSKDDGQAKPPPPPGLGGVVSVETAPDDDVNPVQKPPRLTDIGYGRPAGNGTPVAAPSVYVRAPDLINEIDGRRPVEYGPAPGYSSTPAYGSTSAYSPAPGYGAVPAGYSLSPVYASTPAVRGQDNPMADDSCELQQLPSTSGSDPAVYGYPADYGLPMPELRSPPLRSPHSEAAGRRPLSTSSAELDLSTSRDSVGSGGRRRGWQMGVAVLPPHPAARVGHPAGTDV